MIGSKAPELHFISPVKSNSYTVFVNGIFNTKEMAQTITAPHLKKLVSFTALLNPTQGIIPDICRIHALKRGETTASSKLLLEHLKEIENQTNQVILIGHSEGGLVIKHVLKCLEQQQSSLLKKITVYTFGSSAFIEEQGTVAKVRNYMTINDGFCMVLNPCYILHFFWGGLLLLKNRLFGKTNAIKMANKSLQFLWPTSFNPLIEHGIREANYQKMFQRKISGKEIG